VPNGVYTIWHFPTTGGGALASHVNDINNIFAAAATGTTTFSVIGTAGTMTLSGSVGVCVPSLASSDPSGALFVVVYHIDNRSWGPEPGPEDTYTAHLVFIP